MRRAIVLLALVALAVRPAAAHVGSPDVFFEGDAGPYRLFVAIRTPQVIPGIATIEIRSESPDVDAVEVVPMRLTGPGSERPPTADLAERSPADPQFFTASLWLMERGSMQVRVTARGAHGAGAIGVPVPASAKTTLAMTSGLGALLVALGLVLAISLVAIAAGAAREATLAPGESVAPTARRRARIAALIGALAIAGLLAAGNAWWNAEANAYAAMVERPWRIDASATGCALHLPAIDVPLLPDHGHDVHLFLVRDDGGELAHLHPTRGDDRAFAQALPTLAGGRYRLFADIVLDSGFPVTGTGELELPARACPPLEGDDAAWIGKASPRVAMLRNDARMTLEPIAPRAGAAQALTVRVERADGSPAELEPYMGMLGHAAVMRDDGTVFAHLHPSGSVAMPALALANKSPAHAGHAAHAHHPPPRLTFPFGFPRAGTYRVFVQVKLDGRVETGAFAITVE